MGRWGYRLFESTQDLQIVVDLGHTFNERPMRLFQMVCLAGLSLSERTRLPVRASQHQTEVDQATLSQTVTTIRNQFDTGLGDRFFEKHRANEKSHDDKYRVILAGALMMRVGARIKPEHLQHIRELVPQVMCTCPLTPPNLDLGFRRPGRAQLLAALDNYVAGTPRDFQEPSCFACGRIQVDLGFSLKTCGRCERAWYCSAECQRAQWDDHKKGCLPPDQAKTFDV
ncbi:unnamed protein product [Clonostachys rosea]|uniref:MYND-type domain-containing protein n=1 Tax=Bionectria ochroleuca TaxID=29856 RepID=A0ABY6UE89_BIOOC|nr:unnamed protein product [Clonostachys rosea]